MVVVGVDTPVEITYIANLFVQFFHALHSWVEPWERQVDRKGIIGTLVKPAAEWVRSWETE